MFMICCGIHDSAQVPFVSNESTFEQRRVDLRIHEYLCEFGVKIRKFLQLCKGLVPKRFIIKLNSSSYCYVPLTKTLGQETVL